MRIVLAVDGSDQSYYAARALEHLKQADKITVLHALDVPYPAFPMVMPEVAGELYAVTEKRLREEGERVLKFVVSILPPKTATVSTRLESGRPAEIILSVTGEEKADMIVLGARGLGLVKELLLGSVSHRVLAHAPCPTLIVNRALVSLSHILLPLQGPEDAEAAIRFLTTRPFKEPGEVTVLSTEPFAQSPWLVGASVAESVTQQIRQSAQRFVEDTAARLTALGYCATPVVRTEAPGAAILTHAETTKPDLILMGSRGLGGVSRFLLGSVSHAVLNRAPCPVLIFR
ncbi:MAG: universal stress protein [Nitrospirae bacterium]|nr:universal stress protein [Nitrospirota bacterium]